jgi:hypothetical protein
MQDTTRSSGLSVAVWWGDIWRRNTLRSRLPNIKRYKLRKTPCR